MSVAGERENVEKHEKLLAYQQALRVEEDLLRKVIAKIDHQIHSLQVEQLNILNAMNKNANVTQTDSTQSSDVYVKSEMEEPQKDELDLTVKNTFQSSEEEDDDFDD